MIKDMDEESQRIRNRTNSTPYKEMSDNHTPFNTGLIRSKKKYYVVGYEPFKAKHYRKDEDTEEILTEIDEYRYYKIVDSSRKTIGTITMYTPLERAYSLINRHDYPNHMIDTEFIGYVHFSGKPPSVGVIDTRQPYVTIPPAVAEFNDILVDDAVNVKITRKDGASFECPYHVSRMKNNYVIGLSPFKWLYVDGSEVKEEIIGKKKDIRFNESWMLSDHLLKESVPVKIKLTPLPNAQFYDLSTEAVRIMKLREVKE